MNLNPNDMNFAANLADLIRHFHFLRPWWLLALPVAWALVAWSTRRRARAGDWSQLIDADLLPGLLLEGASAAARTPWRWLLAAWTVAVIALAGPSWTREAGHAYKAAPAWMMVLDLSPSMASADVAPSRVARARYAIDDLLDGARDARVGLVIFSDEAFTVSPLTDDVATLRSLLGPLAPDIMPSTGDQMAGAIDRAGALLVQAPGRGRQMVVLSDGSLDNADAVRNAASLRGQGVTVNVVGIGGDANARASLQQVAASGGGRYVDLAQLPTLLEDLHAQAGGAGASGASNSTSATAGVELSRWLDGGAWLMPLLLVLAAFMARRGYV